MGLFSTTYIQNNKHEVTQEVTKHVHEHRAPTDESVRLVREYEELAEKKLISAFKLEHNQLDLGVNATVLVCGNLAETSNKDLAGRQYMIIFTLNGEKRRRDFYLDGFELQKLRKMDPYIADKELLMKVYRLLAEEIAKAILESSGTKVIGLLGDYN